jgi:hypothetical protein
MIAGLRLSPEVIFTGKPFENRVGSSHSLFSKPFLFLSLLQPFSQSLNMDPLSLSASVIAVTTVSFQVAKGLYKLADGIGSAGTEVRVSANQVSNFSTLLMSINKEVSKPTRISAVEQTLVLDIVGVCDGLMQPLKKLQQALDPLMSRYRDSAEKLRQFGLRLQFYFSCKGKLLYYLDLLGKHSATINVALGVMNLQENRDKTHANFK